MCVCVSFIDVLTHLFIHEFACSNIHIYIYTCTHINAYHIMTITTIIIVYAHNTNNYGYSTLG
jgi:hypothetical protein